MTFEYLGYPVNDFSDEPSFIRLGEKALRPDQVEGVYDDSPLPELPADLWPARDAHLDALRARAERDGATFDNNLSYSLARIDVSRPQGDDQRRTMVYRLRFRPTDYEHFQFPNNALDKEVRVGDRLVKPRDRLHLQAERLGLERLPTMACHAKLGTGTVLLTRPEGGVESVVVTVRSSRQLMVGRHERGASYHLSAAEGMLRPDDGRDGRPSPFRTCWRSLEEELGLRPGREFDPEAVRCLGFYLDTKRAQPFALFFVRTDLSVAAVKERWSEADHRHESERVLGVPWAEESVQGLVLGRIDAEGGAYEVASNHAALGFLMAAAHEHRARAEAGRDGFVFGE